MKYILSLLWLPLCGIGNPSFDEVKSSYELSEALLLDRQGQFLHSIRIDKKRRRLPWVDLDDISPILRRGVVSVEDKRFWSHQGVDWVSLLGNVQHIFSYRKWRGASTLTMQLISLLDNRLRSNTGRYRKKWRQMARATQLEKHWTKSEILEAYLNLVSFRGELQGIAAASSGLFQKSPSGLTAEESWLLISLIRSPNAAPKLVSDRALKLANFHQVSLSSRKLHHIAESSLGRPYQMRPKLSLAPHLANRIFSHGPRAKRVRTSLDRKVQWFAIRKLTEQLNVLADQNVREAALLVVENRTGNVLAYVGNGNRNSKQFFVDGVRARRQAGSTLKPFLYESAFSQNLLSPTSWIADAPLELNVGTGMYRPSNYDNRFRGTVEVQSALASSMNIPAVRILQLVGIERFARKLRELGFSMPESGDFYGPSLSLGSLDVTLWELVGAYRSLANEGMWSELSWHWGKKLPQKRVIDSAAAFVISKILSSREHRASTFGLENALATRFWSAVKTGTSKDMRDNWCVGYSRWYTVGVWVGNFSGDSMWHVSGMSGAAPIWKEMMNWLHQGRSSDPPQPPAGVFEKKGTWYLKGMQSGPNQPAGKKGSASIKFPVEGVRLTYDPDIPSNRQRIYFVAQPTSAHLHWKLNGENVEKNWVKLAGLNAGAQKLQLLNAKGREIDSVSFYVR